MKLRLFLDEDVHAALAVALRKRGYDAVHTLETKRLGLSDESQLNFATQENRCLVTFNVGDFVRLHNRWMDAGREHAGIIVSKQLPVGEMLRRLLTLLQKDSGDSMRGQVRFL
jgi:predicted nuclease of predicted toxin-antitoxin system